MSPQQRSHGEVPKRLFEPPPPRIITYINYILNTVMHEHICFSIFQILDDWNGGELVKSPDTSRNFGCPMDGPVLHN